MVITFILRRTTTCNVSIYNEKKTNLLKREKQLWNGIEYQLNELPMFIFSDVDRFISISHWVHAPRQIFFIILESCRAGDAWIWAFRATLTLISWNIRINLFIFSIALLFSHSHSIIFSYFFSFALDSKIQIKCGTISKEDEKMRIIKYERKMEEWSWQFLT